VRGTVRLPSLTHGSPRERRRREQTLRTDQDNAVVSLMSPRKRGGGQRYFLTLAEKVVGRSRAAGSAVQGDIMAVNPKWCQPYRVWKEYFNH